MSDWKERPAVSNVGGAQCVYQQFQAGLLPR
jgi:hypothetical protein